MLISISKILNTLASLPTQVKYRTSLDPSTKIKQPNPITDPSSARKLTALALQRDAQAKNLSTSRVHQRDAQAKKNVLSIATASTTKYSEFPNAAGCKGDGKLRVVVLDDSPFETEAIMMLCEDASYKVATAETPEEALSWVEQRTVDLLIVDFHQPAPFDALDFVLRQVKGRVPVLLCSADGEIEFLVRCMLPVFVCGFFVKPLTVENIEALPRLAMIHRLTLCQNRWKPNSLYFSSGEQSFNLLSKVRNQKFTVGVLTTNATEGSRIMEVCAAVGLGIRYECKVIATHLALCTLLKTKTRPSNMRGDFSIAGPEIATSPVDPGCNIGGGVEGVDGEGGVGRTLDILLIDMQVMDLQSVVSTLDVCRLNNLSSICK
jgi:CheY-like chemotaxis protein